MNISENKNCIISLQINFLIFQKEIEIISILYIFSIILRESNKIKDSKRYHIAYRYQFHKRIFTFIFTHSCVWNNITSKLIV